MFSGEPVLSVVRDTEFEYILFFKVFIFFFKYRRKAKIVILAETKIQFHF